MTPADLSLTVLHAVRRAVDDGALRVDVPAPDAVKVERPRGGGTGDYATSVALRLAGPAGRAAGEVARILRERLEGAPGIKAVDITGPGFLNFTLDGGGGRQVVAEIRQAGRAYGASDALAGERVRLRPADEHRARVVTDTVLRLLRHQGADADLAPEPDGASFPVLPAPGRTSPPAPAPEGDPLPVLPAPGRTSPPAPAPEGDFDGDSDAVRWALLRPAVHDHALALPPLLVQHERNPLFRVRYAHSRARRLLVNAAQLGFTPAYEHGYESESENERRSDDNGDVLLGALRDHPAVLLSAARLRAPDRLARHLEVVADALLAYQHTVLPLGDEKPSAAHRARLALAEAAGTVLAGGLALLGISAPEQI
ncbi:ArgS-related anticodon-binding protein NrtL [Streptomyces sp. NPDC090025]|uniref:ArgS-related anticodon-binding protein NrtL n=1 Tax=Streptomyces sp. NPDC090025 TaxID=3365922 RepID=UPI0038353822